VIDRPRASGPQGRATLGGTVRDIPTATPEPEGENPPGTRLGEQAPPGKAAASCRAPNALTPCLCCFARNLVATGTGCPYALFMSLCRIEAATGDRKLFRLISAANCACRRRDMEMMRELAPAWSLAKRRAGLTTPTGLPSSKPIEPPRRQERQEYQQPQQGCHLQSPSNRQDAKNAKSTNNPNGVAIFKAQGWPHSGLPWEMRTIHPLPSFPSLLPPPALQEEGGGRERKAWNLAKLWAELKKSKKTKIHFFSGRSVVFWKKDITFHCIQ
jgi:hypothetical protein